MTVEITPEVFNTGWYIQIAGGILLLLGATLAIIGEVRNSRRPRRSSALGIAGFVTAAVGFIVLVLLGITTTGTNASIIAEDRLVEAAVEAGYSNVQDGPSRNLLIAKDSEGTLVLLHVAPLGDDRFIVNEIEG